MPVVKGKEGVSDERHRRYNTLLLMESSCDYSIIIL